MFDRVNKKSSPLVSQTTASSTPLPCFIRRLPEDLLLQIFKNITWRLASPNATRTELWGYNRKYTNVWDAISQTCRDWRTLALGSPSLWTHIYNANTNETRALIDRSQGLPLDVMLDCSKRQYEGSLDLALNQWHRVRLFKVHVSATTMDILGSDRFFALAPHLEVFSFECKASLYSEPILMSLDAPRLHTLRFSVYDILWDRRITSTSIRHFEYTINGVPPNHAKMPVSQALLLLQAMPLLETLVWYHGLTHSPEDTKLSTVHLDHLQLLDVVEESPELGAFLTHTLFPSIARTILRLGNCGNTMSKTVDIMYSAFGVLSSREEAMPASSSQVVAYSLTINVSSPISLSASVLPKRLDTSEVLLNFGLTSSDWLSGSSPLIHTLAAQLRLLNIVDLHIHTKSIPEANICLKILPILFDSVGSVEQLYINELKRSLVTFQSARPIPQNGEDEPQFVLAPLADMTEWQGGELLPLLHRVSFNSDCMSPTFADAVYMLLHQRPVEELFISGPGTLVKGAVDTLKLCTKKLLLGAGIKCIRVRGL
jgi:hypothetical protein